MLPRVSEHHACGADAQKTYFTPSCIVRGPPTVDVMRPAVPGPLAANVDAGIGEHRFVERVEDVPAQLDALPIEQRQLRATG